MNGRGIRKIIDSITLDAEGEPLYKGQSLEHIGRGSYRSVYAIPGSRFVLKVQYDNSEDQNETEWEAYIALRKTKYRNNLMKQCKPFYKNHAEFGSAIMSLQRRVKGLTISQHGNSYEPFRDFRGGLYDLGLDDLHDENIMLSFDKPTRRRKSPNFKVIDMGRMGYSGSGSSTGW